MKRPTKERQLADRLAAEVLRASNIPRRMPIDIDALAESLNATVVERAMTAEAELVDNRLTATIYVRDDRPAARRRFSIAHELAHWVARSAPLEGAVVHRAAEATVSAFGSQEVMASTVAGALLMPRKWLAKQWGEAERLSAAGSPTQWAELDDRRLQVIYGVAEAAQVSMEAAIVRLRDVFGWRQTLIHWTHEDRTWTFDGEAGVMPWEQGLIWPSPEVAMTLGALAVDAASSDAQPFIARRHLQLRVGSVDDEYAISVLVRREGAFALVDRRQQPLSASERVSSGGAGYDTGWGLPCLEPFAAPPRFPA